MMTTMIIIFEFAFDGNGLVQSITYCCITVGG